MVWKYVVILIVVSCYTQSFANGNGKGNDPDHADQDSIQGQGEENVKSGTKSHPNPDVPIMLDNKMKESPAQADQIQNKENRYNSQHGNSQFAHGSRHNSHISLENANLNEANLNQGEVEEDIGVIFAEAGGKDESLLEQVKKLSEKVKQAKSKYLNDRTKHAVQDTEATEQLKIKNKKQLNRIKRSLQSKTEQENHVDLVTDRASNHLDVENEDLDNTKETVMDQFKDIENKVHIGEIYVPKVEVADEEGAFPEDDLIDITGKSKNKIVENTASQIRNTQPPVSQIQPSKTLVFENVQPITTDKFSAAKTLSKEPSVFNNVKPSSVDSFTLTEKTHAPYPPTDKVDSVPHTVNSNIAKKNNRIKHHRQSLERKLSSQTLQGSLKTLVADSASTVQESMGIKATKTEETLASQDHNVKLTVVQGMVMKQNDQGIQYSGTSKDQTLSSVSIEQSSVTPAGEMHKTQVNNQPQRDPGTGIKNNAVNEQNIPKSAESPLSDKDIEQPVVEETATPQTQQSQEQPPPPPPTEEESQANKEKSEKAQEYFEEGEKLVNNSYKKDHKQAYEYFKLAADMGHSKSLTYLGFGYLLGDYIDLDPAKALSIFKELSNKGLPRGQLGLGLSYSAGLAVNSSQAKALIYFTFSALGGDPLAQMVLGYRYLSGIGVESKCETALQYYRKVATTVAENTSSGSPVIQRIRLNEHADNKDSGATLMDADLLQYYEFLADKGDVQAQVVLGQLYYQGGRGVPLNHERAHHYFSIAAESGNSNSLAFLGKMHSEGSPVIAQDHSLAQRYFKRAADKGNPIGQCGLGISYLYGKGIEKDYSKALRFFTQSADQGWSDGQLHLGIMHFSGKGVRRDYKLAVKYFNLASQGGHVLAFYHLAQMHATGTGVLRNCHTAVELYKNVAERGLWASMLMEAHQLYKEGNINEALLKYTYLAELGYEVAQTNVAYILDQGESSLFDQKETFQRALLHWTRAASQGSTMARLKMGDYHYYGYGTDIDYETAATHYRLATEQQHNAQAMFNLGYMHENGLGLKQDVHLAKRFYDMAAETSVDAYVPVSLALVKLGLFYGSDVFNKELENYYTIVNRLDPRYILGPNWDIYLATFLAIVLGIVIILRRQR